MAKSIFNLKNNGLYFIAIVFLLLGVFNICYNIPFRTQIYSIWLNFSLAFIGYFILVYKQASPIPISIFPFILRILTLFSFPLLSDDIYRFIWDGEQILNGINPFSYTPKELIAFDYAWLNPDLFSNMNSPEYYSVYPPINQLVFALIALPGSQNILASIIILRLIIIAFDLGNIYLIKKLLIYYKRNPNLVYLYALNPLVIIELSGNLHFEAVMIFFSLGCFWLLLNNKWIAASLSLALAICSKLLPLIFLPLFIRYLGFKKGIYAGIICLTVTIVLFLPFIHNLILVKHFLESLQLYYGKFEFNGSIYQLLKWAGTCILGYNPIYYTSKILIALTITGFAWVYFYTKNILSAAFWLLFTYSIFGAIVHPWYIIFLVALSPLVNWRFAILWSLLICLSYFTYHTLPYQENLYLLFIEYLALFIFMAYEMRISKYGLKK